MQGRAVYLVTGKRAPIGRYGGALGSAPGAGGGLEPKFRGEERK